MRRIRAGHIAILIVVLMTFGDWLFDGERPFCGWEGVFGHISWCPKPTAWEEQIARERAMQEEQDDPIEQAIIHMIRWFVPDFEP